jgi:transcription-repair coupling factor (superfamily II helicase)
VKLIDDFIRDLASRFRPLPAHKKLVDIFCSKKFPITIDGIRKLPLAAVIADLFRYSKGSFLIVLPNDKEAELFFEDISLCCKDACFLPAWTTLPYRGESPGSQNCGNRVKALTKLISSSKCIVVTSVGAFLTPMVPVDYFKKHISFIKKGQSVNTSELERQMQSCGYIRTPKVSVPGDFAIRGEVFDFYPFGSDEPVRAVFEFDEIEAIKTFDPITQSTTGKLDSVVIPPCKEILWDKVHIEAIKQLGILKESELEKLEAENEVAEEEYIFPLAFEKCGHLSDYMGAFSSLLLIDYELLQQRSEAILDEYKSCYRQSAHDAFEKPSMPGDLLYDFVQETEAMERRIVMPMLHDSQKNNDSITYSYESGRSFFGNFAYLKDELSSLIKNGYKVYIFSSSGVQAQRIGKILEDLDVLVIMGAISGGFVLPDSHIIAIQENEIFGRKKRPPASVKKVKSSPIDSFVELNKGDYVVHINYGIGRFIGIDRIKSTGTERDYIHLEYAGEESIFIPIEQVNLIQRYIGGEGKAPHLDHIGGKAWEARKSKARQAAEELAARLIKLYSRRQNAKGYAFPSDSDMQMEFEAAFPYDETDDQLRCIEEVKADMERPNPMDRLICGDVGFGKTEVAMRAVFKAVAGGKQAAFLCPTTILAEQHYENFLDRFKNFPVEIRLLSRFVPPKRQKAVIEDLKNGKVDIIIGTHRILQKDVIFNNLGIMVVDEEQRFGVKDKEKMKELKTSIDCLSLSATPIPRTLHMSLLKIRDLSVLETPPRNRRPIETFVQPYSMEVVKKAILQEIARGGQVYYLHNRVESLENVRLTLEHMMPELIMETAHGKMSGTELEDIMDRFVHQEIHVLISTTIIENGIDIPNVNTIIIDRADMYGISQLYQLRGRVGRSDRLAYAYLLYPEQTAMTELAMKRLRIISDNTGLGAGFKVAMKDLEVRGAGNLLGRDQSGEISSVGFDMYLRLIDEAVRALDEHKKEELDVHDVYLELEYSGFIPDTYIRDQSEKMEIYKKIASVVSERELDTICSELEDRFGPLPDEVESLVSLAEIRVLCGKLYITSMKEHRGEIVITFGKVHIINIEKYMRLIKESGGKVKPLPDKPNVMIITTDLVDLKEKSAFLRDKLMQLI